MATDTRDESTRDEPSGSPFGVIGELVRSGQLVWRLLRDARVHTPAKLVIPILAGAYFLWPVDLLSDWLPVFGQLDDLGVLLLSARLFVSVCPQSIVREHRERLAGRRTPAPQDPGEHEVVDAEYRVLD